jgi:hypothetical protein
MKKFNELVKESRIALGFKTAKEFHRKKNQEISMSYESYANVESGKHLPPAERLPALVSALEMHDIRGFLYSYCFTMMPNEYFQGFFDLNAQSATPTQYIMKNDSYMNYREKFQALLQTNRLESKHELTDEQIKVIEKDLVCWDIINLFIGTPSYEGFSLEEISARTEAGLELTEHRIKELIKVGVLKLLESGKYLVTQDFFFIPKRAIGDALTHALVQREMGRCYADKRNKPYTRFRFMPIGLEDRDNIEAFIDNFILDSRKFKQKGGKTHYLQILFSDRNDL